MKADGRARSGCSEVALLGATSHIAKGLICNLLRGGGSRLHLYTRSPGPLARFLDATGNLAADRCVVHPGYDDFPASRHEVIVNCVGVGTLRKSQDAVSGYFLVTEKYDNLVIENLRHNPEALYVSLSSGVVYGRGHAAPVGEDSVNAIRVNHVAPQDYYAVARLNAEAKHRSLSGLNIVDLRLFSYFSRHIALDDGYFITDVLDCVQKGTVLVTDEVNIVRDYAHPDDLFALLRLCMRAGPINAAFDLTSAKPVEKQEILDYFSTSYGLRYETRRTLDHGSATGQKNVYCSNYLNAAAIGYRPAFTSMDTIQREARCILRGGGADL